MNEKSSINSPFLKTFFQKVSCKPLIPSLSYLQKNDSNDFS